MADIASALKTEVIRLARKELRAQMEPIKKSVAHLRAQVTELHTEVSTLKAKLKQLDKQTPKAVRMEAIETPKRSRQRFTAKGFATMRGKLGLSCVEMGHLIGASDQSVRKWEDGESVPREKFQQAIFSLRGLGKREITARLGGGSPVQAASTLDHI